MSSVDFDTVMPVTHMTGDYPEDTQLLRDASAKAHAFISGYAWCKHVREQYFGLGIGGIVSVLLFEIATAREDIDELLWVIVGDLPSAYLVTDEAPDPAEALAKYIALMRQWISAVNEGGDLSAVYPVSAAPTPDNAAMLERRLNYLEYDLLPEWRMTVESRVRRGPT